MIRRLVLAVGFIALVVPVFLTYLSVAAPGPASLDLPLPPAPPGVRLAALVSFLAGWAVIAALGFPYSSGRPVADSSSADGGMPIIRRHVRVRWAASANPAA